MDTAARAGSAAAEIALCVNMRLFFREHGGRTSSSLTLLSSTRPRLELPSSSRVSAAGPLRVSGSRRPRQPADSPLRQNTVKGREVWRARCNTHTHTHNQNELQ